MIPEEIFDSTQRYLPQVNFDLTIVKHERFGEEAIKVVCTVNDLAAKRIIRRMYENPFSISICWFINEKEVNNYYASILENIYESQVKGGAILVY